MNIGILQIFNNEYVKLADLLTEKYGDEWGNFEVGNEYKIQFYGEGKICEKASGDIPVPEEGFRSQKVIIYKPQDGIDVWVRNAIGISGSSILINIGT